MAVFHFKQFDVDDSACGMKVCSDSVLLGAWFLPDVVTARSVVDAGSGSGLLSLMAAQICPQAMITSIEIDSAAAAATLQNAQNSAWAKRIEVVCGDFLQSALLSPIDAIICNPPYFTNGEQSSDAARAVARHQASLTYSSLCMRSADLLTSTGCLGLVSPPEFEQEIIYTATMAGLSLQKLCRVRTSLRRESRRLLWNFSKKEGKNQISELVIRDTNGVPTPEYVALVEPFYTKIS